MTKPKPTNKTDREILKACLFQPRYSGLASRRIWSEVNKSPGDHVLCDFACALQHVEQLFLVAINDRVAARVKKLLRKKGPR